MRRSWRGIGKLSQPSRILTTKPTSVASIRVQRQQPHYLHQDQYDCDLYAQYQQQFLVSQRQLSTFLNGDRRRTHPNTSNVSNDHNKPHNGIQVVESPVLPPPISNSHPQYFEEFIQRRTYPSRALKWLEDPPQHNNEELTVEMQRELLALVTNTKNLQLLERATRLPVVHEDVECFRLLLAGWTRIPQIPNTTSATKTQSTLEQTTTPNTLPFSLANLVQQQQQDHGIKLTGPQVAAHLLLQACREDTHKVCSLSGFRTVLAALAEEGNYTLATNLLQELCQLPNLQPDRDCFHRVLQACTKAGATEAAMESFRIMQAVPVTPTLSTYKILLQAQTNGTQAYQLLQSMPMTPDRTAYNITLNALAKEGNYKLAQQVVLALLQQQPSATATPKTMDSGSNDPELSPAAFMDATTDPIALRTLLQAYSNANTIQAAEQAEDFLRVLPPTVPAGARAYTTIVALWCKLGRPERAKGLLEEVMTRYFESDKDLYWQPDPVSFRTVIGAYSKHKEKFTKEMAAQAQQVLEDMHTVMGYEPNVITCNTVLNCWALAREPEAAEDLLQLMVQWNLEPDIVSYNTVIGCYAKLGNARQCVQWLNRLAEQAASSNAAVPSSSSAMPAPNTVTVTSAISALSRLGSASAAEEAEQWLVQMHDWQEEYGWDCAPNLVTYNAMLMCWARAKNGARAEYLLKELQGTDHKPNTASYNAVLQAYGNEWPEVERLLEEMVVRGLQVNPGTLSIVQRAWPKEDKDPRQWQEVQDRYFYYVATDGRNSKHKQKGNRRKKQNKGKQVHQSDSK